MFLCSKMGVKSEKKIFEIPEAGIPLVQMSGAPTFVLDGFEGPQGTVLTAELTYS